MSAVIICDKEYPRRVAFAVLNQVLDDFLQRYPRDRWSSAQFPLQTYPELKEMVAKYQDPHQADNLLRVQKELDETKIIMVQ